MGGHYVKTQVPYEERTRQEARYVILRSLADERSGSMVDALLEGEIQAHAGIFRDRAWLQSEMRYLENVGAIHVIEAGSNLIAKLRKRGRSHVERLSFLDGVKRPSDED